MYVYVIGSLRNPEVPEIGNQLRAAGLEVFDDWFSGGYDADEAWRRYETQRGRSFVEALQAPHAVNVFELDKRHLDRCDAAVLVMPAGKSGHLELGYVIGRGQRGYVLLDDPNPSRYELMYRFATAVCRDLDELLVELRR